MLDIQRGIHVDAGSAQLLHVLPVLHMPAAGRIAAGQITDQHQRRRTGQQALQIRQLHTTALDGRQAGQTGLLCGLLQRGRGTAQGHTGSLQPAGSRQQAGRLATAARSTEEDGKPSPAGCSGRGIIDRTRQGTGGAVHRERLLWRSGSGLSVRAAERRVNKA